MPSRLLSAATADLSDAFAHLSVAEALWRDYGGVVRFAGPAMTLKVHEDNTLVRAELETPGEGRVLVIDGGGSLRCALVGGLLGELGVTNGWAGIIVYGCVRDSSELGRQKIGIKALATHPRKSQKRGEGARGVPVTFAGVQVLPGHWVYADEDGWVVSPEELPLG